jgi:hypothetical protein
MGNNLKICIKGENIRRRDKENALMGSKETKELLGEIQSQA